MSCLYFSHLSVLFVFEIVSRQSNPGFVSYLPIVHSACAMWNDTTALSAFPFEFHFSSPNIPFLDCFFFGSEYPFAYDPFLVTAGFPMRIPHVHHARCNAGGEVWNGHFGGRRNGLHEVRPCFATARMQMPWSLEVLGFCQALSRKKESSGVVP
jgi:hypothetical protein